MQKGKLCQTKDGFTFHPQKKQRTDDLMVFFLGYVEGWADLTGMARPQPPKAVQERFSQHERQRREPLGRGNRLFFFPPALAKQPICWKVQLKWFFLANQFKKSGARVFLKKESGQALFIEDIEVRVWAAEHFYCWSYISYWDRNRERERDEQEGKDIFRNKRNETK